MSTMTSKPLEVNLSVGDIKFPAALFKSTSMLPNLSIEVYNLQGRIINKIVKDRIDPGYYTFNWDGTNEPSGIYIIKVQISDTIKIYRTVLIK